MHLEKRKKAVCVLPTVLSLSLPGMAQWWCEGRFCSGGMLLLPPTPTSSGHSSQRQAGEGASSAGSWSPSLSCLVVSAEDLPTAGLLLLPSALVPLSKPKPVHSGFQALPSLNIPSSWPVKPLKDIKDGGGHIQSSWSCVGQCFCSTPWPPLFGPVLLCWEMVHPEPFPHSKEFPHSAALLPSAFGVWPWISSRLTHFSQGSWRNGDEHNSSKLP